jgi:hypothetical protein
MHGGDGIGVSCLAAVANGMAPMSPEEVADIVVQGLADERFLILTHPQVAEWVQRKAADPERWIRGMRRVQRI